MNGSKEAISQAPVLWSWEVKAIKLTIFVHFISRKFALIWYVYKKTTNRNIKNPNHRFSEKYKDLYDMIHSPIKKIKFITNRIDGQSTWKIVHFVVGRNHAKFSAFFCPLLHVFSLSFFRDILAWNFCVSTDTEKTTCSKYRRSSFGAENVASNFLVWIAQNGQFWCNYRVPRTFPIFEPQKPDFQSIIDRQHNVFALMENIWAIFSHVCDIDQFLSLPMTCWLFVIVNSV